MKKCFKDRSQSRIRFANAKYNRKSKNLYSELGLGFGGGGLSWVGDKAFSLGRKGSYTILNVTIDYIYFAIDLYMI